MIPFPPDARWAAKYTTSGAVNRLAHVVLDFENEEEQTRNLLYPESYLQQAAELLARILVNGTKNVQLFEKLCTKYNTAGVDLKNVVDGYATWAQRVDRDKADENTRNHLADAVSGTSSFGGTTGTRNRSATPPRAAAASSSRSIAAMNVDRQNSSSTTRQIDQLIAFGDYETAFRSLHRLVQPFQHSAAGSSGGGFSASSNAINTTLANNMSAQLLLSATSHQDEHQALLLQQSASTSMDSSYGIVSESLLKLISVGLWMGKYAEVAAILNIGPTTTSQVDHSSGPGSTTAAAGMMLQHPPGGGSAFATGGPGGRAGSSSSGGLMLHQQDQLHRDGGATALLTSAAGAPGDHSGTTVLPTTTSLLLLPNRKFRYAASYDCCVAAGIAQLCQHRYESALAFFATGLRTAQASANNYAVPDIASGEDVALYIAVCMLCTGRFDDGALVDEAAWGALQATVQLHLPDVAKFMLTLALDAGAGGGGGGTSTTGSVGGGHQLNGGAPVVAATAAPATTPPGSPPFTTVASLFRLCLLDMHLGPIAASIFSFLQQRLLIDYVRPYYRLRLSTLEQKFGVSLCSPSRGAHNYASDGNDGGGNLRPSSSTRASHPDEDQWLLTAMEEAQLGLAGSEDDSLDEIRDFEARTATTGRAAGGAASSASVPSLGPHSPDNLVQPCISQNQRPRPTDSQASQRSNVGVTSPSRTAGGDFSAIKDEDSRGQHQMNSIFQPATPNTQQTAGSTADHVDRFADRPKNGNGGLGQTQTDTPSDDEDDPMAMHTRTGRDGTTSSSSSTALLTGVRAELALLRHFACSAYVDEFDANTGEPITGSVPTRLADLIAGLETDGKLDLEKQVFKKDFEKDGGQLSSVKHAAETAKQIADRVELMLWQLKGGKALKRLGLDDCSTVFEDFEPELCDDHNYYSGNSSSEDDEVLVGQSARRNGSERNADCSSAGRALPVKNNHAGAGDSQSQQEGGVLEPPASASAAASSTTRPQSLKS
ncbi:unnamed protein product [Amoebophrya sp. A120]|nr:unnamed protein product [Amoebophrya sp. A120]|eukprot:GSA120T00000101001.1